MNGSIRQRREEPKRAVSLRAMSSSHGRRSIRGEHQNVNESPAGRQTVETADEESENELLGEDHCSKTVKE